MTLRLEVLALLLLLVAGDAVCFYEVALAEDAGAGYVATRRKTNACRDMMQLVTDAEAGQRSYLVTGEETYLAPYYQALRRLASLNDELERGGVAGIPEVAAVRRLVAEKLDELAQTISTRRLKSPEEAVAMVRGNRGRVLMDELRTEVDRVKAEDEVAAAAWSDAIQKSLAVVKYLRGVQTVLAVVLGMLLVLARRPAPNPEGTPCPTAKVTPPPA